MVCWPEVLAEWADAMGCPNALTAPQLKSPQPSAHPAKCTAGQCARRPRVGVLRLEGWVRGRPRPLGLGLTTRHFQGLRVNTVTVRRRLVLRVQSAQQASALVYVRYALRRELLFERVGSESTAVAWNRDCEPLPHECMVVVSVGERRVALRLIGHSHSHPLVSKLVL